VIVLLVYFYTLSFVKEATKILVFIFFITILGWDLMLIFKILCL